MCIQLRLTIMSINFSFFQLKSRGANKIINLLPNIFEVATTMTYIICQINGISIKKSLELILLK